MIQQPSSLIKTADSSRISTKFATSQFFRYFLVALIALLIDTSALSFFVRWARLPLAIATTLAFFAGTAVNYILSTKLVFAKRRFLAQKNKEFLFFLIIGIIGLTLTQIILNIGSTQLKFNLEIVKITAAGITFIFNFLARKIFLF